MISKVTDIQSKDFSIGLYTRSDIINPNPNLSPNCMDIQWFFDNSIGKRLGSTTTNSVAITSGATAGWIVDNAANNLSTQIQAYWKLNEASGNRSDSFGGNTLSDKNSTASITGIRNLGALFASANSNSLILANTQTVQTGVIPFSIAGWFYLNSTSATVESTIVSKRDPGVDASTVLLLHCDGVNASTSFPDSSPSAKTVTANGNAQVDTAQKEFGSGSAKFDGSGDFLSALNSADWDFGSGDFTIDFWVRFNTLTSPPSLVIRDGANYEWRFYLSSSKITFASADAGGTPWSITSSTTFLTATWYHIAGIRFGNAQYLFVNGTKEGTDGAFSGSLSNGSDPIAIGGDTLFGTSMDGWMDEVRISKGIARWTANFTPPVAPYSIQAYEYSVYVNTDNLLTFSVSSSNLGATTSLTANSFGAVSLNLWYNFVAWHQTAGGSTAAHIGLSVNLSATTAAYASGLKIGSAPFVMGGLSNGLAGSATAYLDGRVDEVGFWKKILNTQNRSDIYAGGSGNTYSSGADPSAWYSFDFGASSLRWVTVCAGTGIVASSNLGTTFVNIATTRTATYQYLDRSKNVLIATSDAQDVPLFWAGSAGTFAQILAPNSAPQAKFSINYQGFLILMNYMNSNSVVSNRGFSYADENTQLTNSWLNAFDLPSSADDEITAPFILNKFLYVSTKYKIFRLNYSGGNPDWSYIQVANFGYVPRTVKVCSTKGAQGQLAIGLDWTKRMRAFYGYNDEIISNNVENNNNYCDFAMNKISLLGSGLLVSNAEFDINTQEYRLNVAIGAQSTQTTHAIVLNARTLAMYPYSNQPYQTVCMAQSANRQFLLAFDRSGLCHILNSGNLDAGTIAVNEFYDSPLLFNESPSNITKNKQINFFFSKDSCGTLQYQERFDFSNIFSPMRPLRNYLGQAELLGTESSIQLVRTVDLPSVQNIYQYRITSSAGTANPWKLTHFDLFNSALGVGRGG